MEYENILFGLQPILNADSIENVPLETVYLNSYLTVLDQLAVSLRSPSNRDIVGESGLFSNLLRVLDDTLSSCLKDSISNQIVYFKLANELIRCVANALVDNNNNREIFLGKSSENDLQKRNTIIDYYVGRILNLMELPNESNEGLLSDLQMRTIVLVRNLCLDNEIYTKRVAKFVRGPLFLLLKHSQHVFLEEPDTVVLGAELLSQFIQADSKGFNCNDILFFSETIALVSKTVPEEIVISQDEENKNEIEEDPSVELLYILSESLEIIVTKNEKELDYKNNADTVTTIQVALLKALDTLNSKEFQNKLIIMRRIVSISGFISANETNSNHNEQNICINSIKNSEMSYTLAASYIILSNSINSRQDVDNVLQQLTIDDIIASSSHLKDPMQFQGFLDILKKLLNISSAMFLSKEVLKTLSITLKICHDQTKYFQNLLPLLNSLLTKLITVLPGTTLQTLITDSTSPMLAILLESDCLIVCLTLDKILVSQKNTDDVIKNKLWDVVFKFRNSANGNEGLPINVLFQMTKTIGIYLRNCDTNNISNNYLFDRHLEDLIVVLDTILSIKDNAGMGGESAFNNGKFIAGIILNILKKTDVLTSTEEELRGKALFFF